MKPFLKKLARALPKSKSGDFIYCLIMFFAAHRRLPHRNSNLFNDYLFFLKTSDQIDDILRQLSSDKILVKAFIDALAPGTSTPATIGTIAEIGDLSHFRASQKCVVKPAHGNGSVVFLEAGETLSAECKEVLAQALNSSLYETSRERNYKNLRKRLICEERLPIDGDIKDYKLFCFKGQVKLIQVDSSRFVNHSRRIYTSEWKITNIVYNFPIGPAEPKPDNLASMISIAEKVASLFEFVRVDFFLYNDLPILGEVTHCPEAAHGRFENIDQERVFSELLFN